MWSQEFGCVRLGQVTDVGDTRRPPDAAEKTETHMVTVLEEQSTRGVQQLGSRTGSDRSGLHIHTNAFACFTVYKSRGSYLNLLCVSLNHDNGTKQPS